MIDKSIIKRNYSYIIYNILKDETSKQGKHLSIKEICELINKKYELNIDKNTVSRIFDDLITFGVDIKKEDYKYYLDKRVFTDSEVGLLIDGIESISVLPPDSKEQIYEKICKLVGKNINTLDYYIYDNEDYFIEEELLDIVETVYTAIGLNKCLEVFEPILFKLWIIDELTLEEEKYLNEYFLEGYCFVINPYQLFRNVNNEIYLLFYYKIPTRYISGALRLSSLEKDWISVSDKDKDKIDIGMLLSKDLTSFISPKDYLNKEMKLSAKIVPVNNDDNNMNFQFILDECESYEKTNDNSVKVYNIVYKYKNEDTIKSLCIECAEYVKVLEGSRLYEELESIYNSLKIHFSK